MIKLEILKYIKFWFLDFFSFKMSIMFNGLQLEFERFIIDFKDKKDLLSYPIPISLYVEKANNHWDRHFAYNSKFVMAVGILDDD